MLSSFKSFIPDAKGKTVEVEPGMRLNHGVADEAIRECCIKVAVVSMSANTALLLPFGEAFGLIFSQAAAAGFIAKLQSDLIIKLSKIYKTPISKGEQDEVHKLITGVANKGVMGNTPATMNLKTVSKAVATTSTSKFIRLIPVVGPLTMATISMTSTYIIGKRCKSYFTKRLEIIDAGGNVEEEEIQLEKWHETVGKMTAREKENLSSMLNSAIVTSKNKMESLAKNAADHTNKGKTKLNSQYKDGKKNLNKVYGKGKNIVASKYAKGLAVVTKVRNSQKAKYKSKTSNASSAEGVAKDL